MNLEKRNIWRSLHSSSLSREINRYDNICASIEINRCIYFSRPQIILFISCQKFPHNIVINPNPVTCSRTILLINTNILNVLASILLLRITNLYQRKEHPSVCLIYLIWKWYFQCEMNNSYLTGTPFFI